MIYGYCRVSTAKQKLGRQIENIKKVYPDAQIICETYTGIKITGRKEFNRLLKKVKPGDIIVFDEVSRMSRDAVDGCRIYHELHDKGISLVFLKEPHINTSTYDEALRSNDIPLTGTDVDLILDGIKKYLRRLTDSQINLAFESAQRETDYIKQRTKEGVNKAIAEGKIVGRAPGTKYHTKEEARIRQVITDYHEHFGGNLNDIQCIRLAECSRNTYYKYKKIILEEEG